MSSSCDSRTTKSLQKSVQLQPRHFVVATCVLALCCLAQLATPVSGLTCYQTENGETSIVKNDEWTYCAMVPATKVGDELVNGSQFGLGSENDMLGMYNNAFGMSEDEYRILTVCIYERYDFSRFMSLKEGTAVEFTFRCVCNYDLCNTATGFSTYLSNLKTESFGTSN